MKTRPEQIDEKVFHVVALAQQPVIFAHILKTVNSLLQGGVLLREVDRSLQRLKKAGKIRFEGKSGWKVVG